MTSVTSSLSREFAYRDRKLGDTEAITVATASDVFYPTSTTTLLLRAARRALVHRPRSVLDLGCGCGIVAIVLAKCVASGALVCASDLSAGAVRLARYNASRTGAVVDCRRGSRFAAVELVEEQWYPLSEELLAHGALVEELARDGSITLEQRGTRLCWATRVYTASGRART